MLGGPLEQWPDNPSHRPVTSPVPYHLSQDLPLEIPPPAARHNAHAKDLPRKSPPPTTIVCRSDKKLPGIQAANVSTNGTRPPIPSGSRSFAINAITSSSALNPNCATIGCPGLSTSYSISTRIGLRISNRSVTCPGLSSPARPASAPRHCFGACRIRHSTVLDVAACR